MPPLPILIPILIIFPTLSLIPATTSSQYVENDPILIDCPGVSNYTSPSPFENNLGLLLSNLTSSAPSSPSFFSTATVGRSAAERVFGLAQCRPDSANASVCSNCLTRSASAAPISCPLGKSTAIRFDYCILRYSNQRFFSRIEDRFKMKIYTTENPSEPTAFNHRLKDLMVRISSKAAAAESKFAVDTTNYSEYGNVYGMAQCTRDLSDGDCALCLNGVAGFLPYGRIWGQAVEVSCALSFGTQLLFSQSLIPPPPPRAVAEQPPPPSERKGNTTKTVPFVIPVVVALVLLSAICILLRRRKSARRRTPSTTNGMVDQGILFDLAALRAATNNFSDANKLGEGGFGAVYKGVLQDGQEIAVKRLSRTSKQGLVELRNEVVFMAKLQHKNLVRLLGCCLEEQEKLLVYEYLPNTSFDKFLFDPIRRQQLDWVTRYKIIEGIGRGLVYLHEDSRLKIVHRDLKPSNILLDEDMNPKISDFGLAKLFGIDETQGNTNRIAGTFGYMAPEYALHGYFSTKSDVFSYGVLVLQIVTGQKNMCFEGSGHAVHLLSYVWKHWNEGTGLEVKDQDLGERCIAQEVLRCIHIGLLCVQEDPTKRPSMASVVLMLSSQSVDLPKPSTPAFFVRGSMASDSDVLDKDSDLKWLGSDYSSGYMRQSKPVSVNDVSITEIDPR